MGRYRILMRSEGFGRMLSLRRSGILIGEAGIPWAAGRQS